MAFVYAVRCNFSDPAREQAWNDWYNGPKRKQMLSKPLFITGQRFKASSLNTHRKYLALWQVESPDAFTTPEYKSDWGFFEWAPFITDWSRDLYQATSDPARFEIPVEEALYFVSFEDLSLDDARRERDRISAARPGVTWMEAVGLDKHSTVIGLQRVEADWRPGSALAAGPFQETVFTPLTDCGKAADL